MRLQSIDHLLDLPRGTVCQVEAPIVRRWRSCVPSPARAALIAYEGQQVGLLGDTFDHIEHEVPIFWLSVRNV